MPRLPYKRSVAKLTALFLFYLVGRLDTFGRTYYVHSAANVFRTLERIIFSVKFI